MAENSPTIREPYWAWGVAGALMTGAPVWNYLYVNGYPFDRPEAVLLPVIAGTIGAGIACVAHRIGGVFQVIAFGMLLFVFADLQFALEKWVYTLIVVLCCLALAAMLGPRRAAITSLALGAFQLASLPRLETDYAVTPETATSVGSPRAPLLVHLVLDEMWGIGGLRAAGDTATANFLSRFYLERGFEVYDAAYSRWGETHQSIPAVLSLGPDYEIRTKGPFSFEMRAIPYFARLRQLGYRIDVFQSSHLDVCSVKATPVHSCDETPAISIGNVGYLRGAWTHRALLAIRFYLGINSHVYRRLASNEEVWRRSFAGRGLEELADVRHTIAEEPPEGRAIFVHVLLPHRPLEVNEKCELYSDLGKRVFYDGLENMTDSEFADVLELYGEQVRCVHSAVAELIAAVDSAAGPDGSIVIIHGDHGSRLSQHSSEPVGVSTLGGDQLNAEYSTLLAVRRPGVAPARHGDPVPVQAYIRELVKRDFKGVVEYAWRHYVRSSDSSKAVHDTLRTLTVAEMPWRR